MILNHHGIMGLKQKVRIGDKLYKVVTIGNQVWLAENLALKTTNSVDREGYPEFGLYYPYSDIEEIENSVDGWHVPTEAELEELLISNTPDNTHKVQSTNYKSVWPSATNSTKFSAVPAAHSNDNTNLNRALLWYHAGYLGLQVNSLVFTNSTPALSFSVRLIKDTEPVEIGGRKYKTVKIGNQIWLAENLEYLDDNIVLGNSEVSSTVAQANWYNNDKSSSYGLLYNYTAVKYIEEHKSTICPGWHVPTEAELKVIADLGYTAIRDNLWNNYPGDNSSRFTLKAAGLFEGSFSNRGLGTGLLSISTAGNLARRLNSVNQINEITSTTKTIQLSLRLIKDSHTSSTTLSSLSTAPSEE